MSGPLRNLLGRSDINGRSDGIAKTGPGGITWTGFCDSCVCDGLQAVGSVHDRDQDVVCLRHAAM